MAVQGHAPVPMKLFATWEVDRTSPNCIPRICSLRLTRLVMYKTLESDLTSVIIAVRMQSSKRTLRSNEIFLQQSGLLDTGLDLLFSLQYPHILKGDGNKLQIMLQRRKKYKNRTILGFKTLAVGLVNMAQVLQMSVDDQLNLYSTNKNGRVQVAKVVVAGLSSQPVDQEPRKQRSHDRSPDLENYSDEDESDISSEGSDSGDVMADKDLLGEEEQEPEVLNRKGERRKMRRGHQRNFKQKFISLLKKFKVSEEGEVDPDSFVDHDQDPVDEDYLYDGLDDLNVSDSGPELDDSSSIISTPKPVLKPFFSQSNIVHSPSSVSEEMESIASEKENGVDNDSEIILATASQQEWDTAVGINQSFPGSISKNTNFPVFKDKKSASIATSDYSERKQWSTDESEMVKVLPFELSQIWGNEEEIPDNLIFVDSSENFGQVLCKLLRENKCKAVGTHSSADVRVTFAFISNKIQKFCNSKTAAPKPLKIAIVGEEGYVNIILQPYVEIFSSKPPDWQNYIQFLIIPIGINYLSKYLASIDSKYNNLFAEFIRKESSEKFDKEGMLELICRIKSYVLGAKIIHPLPIGEAMVNYKIDDNSAQKFIPFVNDVRIGTTDSLASSQSLSADIGDDFGAQQQMVPSVTSSALTTVMATTTSTNASTTVAAAVTNMNSSLPISNTSTISSSPPSSFSKDTPPNSPALLPTLSSELVDLQIDYWYNSGKKESNKSSLKTTIKSLNICRLPVNNESTFHMIIITKEKNKKIIRIGKKPKEAESKSQVIDGINRLICMSKGQSNLLKVTIDGVEWSGVKFFQVSPQWQTHIKLFPIALFSIPDTTS